MMKNTQTLSLNSRMKKRIAIIGAGAMGLSAAYYAIKKGYRVSIFEVDKIPGGMVLILILMECLLNVFIILFVKVINILSSYWMI